MNNEELSDCLCFSSPVGWITICASSAGIYRLDLHGQSPPDRNSAPENRPKVSSQFELKSNRHQSLLHDAKTAILTYFSKRIPLPDLPLDIRSGTAFQQDVWRSLCKVPFGETRSYRDIAKSIDKPRAFRAVGQACGSNPIAIIIPCHRVVAQNGKLGGYGSGLHIKRALLELERNP